MDESKQARDRSPALGCGASRAVIVGVVVRDWVPLPSISVGWDVMGGAAVRAESFGASPGVGPSTLMQGNVDDCNQGAGAGLGTAAHQRLVHDVASRTMGAASGQGRILCRRDVDVLYDRLMLSTPCLLV